MGRDDVDVLSELAVIRADLRRLAALQRRRQRLIRRARDLGHSERRIADAAGVSPARVHQVLTR